MRSLIALGLLIGASVVGCGPSGGGGGGGDDDGVPPVDAPGTGGDGDGGGGFADGRPSVDAAAPATLTGKVWAPNLTPDKETGLGRYHVEQIKRALRDGKRLDGKPMAPPMSIMLPHYSG